MTDLRHLFVYSERFHAVARWYGDLLGIATEAEKDDSVWLAPEGTKLVVHGKDEATNPAVAAAGGFVPWFHVDDLDAAYERARAADAVVGERFESYFFARDPEGRFIGVRRRPA